MPGLGTVDRRGDGPGEAPRPCVSSSAGRVCRSGCSSSRPDTARDIPPTAVRRSDRGVARVVGGRGQNRAVPATALSAPLGRAGTALVPGGLHPILGRAASVGRPHSFAPDTRGPCFDSRWRYVRSAAGRVFARSAAAGSLGSFSWTFAFWATSIGPPRTDQSSPVVKVQRRHFSVLLSFRSLFSLFDHPRSMPCKKVSSSTEDADRFHRRTLIGFPGVCVIGFRGEQVIG